MTPLLAALLTASAAAQTLRAPALTRSALPGFGPLSAVTANLAAPRAYAPVLPTAVVGLPAAPALAALPALPAAQPAAPAAAPRAVIAKAGEALTRPGADAAAQAPVLSGLFEGRLVRLPDAVAAAPSASRPSLLSAPNAARPAAEPAPPAPKRPVWKTAGLYALRTAGFLGAFYGGFRVDDMAYLGAEFLGPWGLLVSLPVLGAAAWWLGRRQDASPLGRSVMGGLFASAGFVVVGQQFWDLFHSPFGLFVGVPAGVLLALVASGLLKNPVRKA